MGKKRQAESSAKVGRPELSESEFRKQRQYRANDEEQTLWQQAADSSGQTFSAWMRDVLNRAARRVLRK